MRKILILLMLSTLYSRGEERKLEYHLAPTDTASIMSAKEWDFSISAVISTKHGLSTTIHGDSLLGEYAAGYREWFVIRKDTLYYAGEETREYIVSPTTLYPTWVFTPVQGDCRNITIDNEGRRFSRYQYNETGMLSTEVGSVGNLILFTGDTLRNVVVTREKKVVSEYERTVYRWYADSTVLPVAVQRMIHRFDTDLMTEDLYILSPDDLEELRVMQNDAADKMKEISENALKNIRVEYVNGYARIEIPAGEDDVCIPLQIDIIDIAGNLYRHRETQASGGVSIAIPVSDLPPREYIVALSTPLLPQTQSKHYIINR